MKREHPIHIRRGKRTPSLHAATLANQREFSRRFQISQPDADELWQEINTLVFVVSNQATDPRTDYLKIRSTARKQIRGLIKYLRKAEALLEAPADRLEFFVGPDLPNLIGDMLSDNAIAQLLGFELAERSNLDLSGPRAGQNHQTWKAIKRQIKKRRTALVNDDHLRLLLLTFQAIRGCLETSLNDKVSRGGIPKDRTRQMILHTMIHWFHRTSGSAPTASVGNMFEQMCTSVLYAVGLDAEGIDKAISREVRLLINAGRLPPARSTRPKRSAHRTRT